MALTPEDLDQIRAIVAEIVMATVIASEARLIARQDAIAADLKGRQERAVDVINGEISGLRSELSGRIETLEKRFDNLLNISLGNETKLIYIARSVDEALSIKHQTTVRLDAQQKAFDQLMARIKRIEDELHPGSNPA